MGLRHTLTPEVYASGEGILTGRIGSRAIYFVYRFGSLNRKRYGSVETGQ